MSSAATASALPFGAKPQEKKKNSTAEVVAASMSAPRSSSTITTAIPLRRRAISASSSSPTSRSRTPSWRRWLAFVTFAVSFLARPFGSLLFGHFGDKLGRKKTLVAALMMMGIATFVVGLLPGYDVLGPASVVLFVRLPRVPGRWACRRVVGRGARGDGERAEEQARALRQLPEPRRSDRILLRLRREPRARHRAHDRPDGRVRLAHPVFALHLPRRRRPCRAPAHGRDARSSRRPRPRTVSPRPQLPRPSPPLEARRFGHLRGEHHLHAVLSAWNLVAFLRRLHARLLSAAVPRLRAYRRVLLRRVHRGGMPVRRPAAAASRCSWSRPRQRLCSAW